MVVSQGKVYESFADVGGEARGSLQREMVGQRAKSKLPKHLPLILAVPRAVRVALIVLNGLLVLSRRECRWSLKGIAVFGRTFQGSWTRGTSLALYCQRPSHCPSQMKGVRDLAAGTQQSIVRQQREAKKTPAVGMSCVSDESGVYGR